MDRARQIRAARALVGWSQAELAAKVDLSKNAISNIENGADPKSSTLDRIRRVLEEAGAEFTNDGGVRPKSKQTDRG